MLSSDRLECQKFCEVKQASSSGRNAELKFVTHDLDPMQNVTFQHRHKTFEIKITHEQALELYLDNCLRKRREQGEKEPQYVWTNVELEWEEHHYVEARYWASSSRLEVTVNGELLLEQVFTE